MTKIKVSDFIARYLKERYQVKDIFLISGGGAMHLNDSFGKHTNYITAHHEQSLSIAAEGYSRISQQLAVVNVTTGPGGLNCLNGVFGEWTDSVPVLYISGQVKYTTTIASCREINLRQLGDQEVDIVSVVKPLTKYAVMVTDANDIKYHIDKAIYEATNGRFGPVWLDIPMNIQSAEISVDNLREFTPPKKEVDNFKLESDIKFAIDKLSSSCRPLIICGHGVRLSNQIDNFKKIVDKLDIPFLLSLNGIDIVESGHDKIIGRFGTIGQRAGNFALQNADVVLFLGTRNNIRQISYN